jgi:hypothetical protein
MAKKKNAELGRLNVSDVEESSEWKRWGPYLAERGWGTVREDYSPDGDAWNFLTHDMSRSKAYRWGEDGLGGICDYYQTMIFSFAFWNGKDPILKEKLFGLTPYEGNHGEDVKECYYYLDATPSHSYLKFLYKYPHSAFPYGELVEKNKGRGLSDREFELYDTQAFHENRYFDIFIEYAKESETDICVKLQICNRGPESASIHILPHLWYRNEWGWKDKVGVIPEISIDSNRGGVASLFADSSKLPQPANIVSQYQVPSLYLYGSTPDEILFTNNETNNERLYGSHVKNITPYVKDAFHRYVIHKENATCPEKTGTKACFYYRAVEIPAMSSKEFFFRLSEKKLSDPLSDVKEIFAQRKMEADEFYDGIHGNNLSDDDRSIQRMAFAGMIWTKQFYMYNVRKWLSGDNPLFPPPPNRGKIRNGKWGHLYALDVFSMPDKWEYPWFAAWDLAFHAVSFSLIDTHFAKTQLRILLTHMYQHANGQIPAYEWGFSDLNPPVQGWALWRLYEAEQKKTGKGDYYFLHWGFLKLLHNFDWWVNKVDKLGNNFFEGGFLGLDNISVIDRSRPLKNGEVIEQSDATGWMGFYSLVLMRISLELAKKDPVYEGIALICFEQFVYIASTMHEKNRMWDEADGFFYDIILHPDETVSPLKIRSFVGIIPFYSLFAIDEEQLKKFPRFYERLTHFSKHNPDLVDRCLTRVETGKTTNLLFTMMNMSQIKMVLAKVFDSSEFLSDFGLRSLSKYHKDHPYSFGDGYVSYEPGESLEKIKGGNSNWRGPIWLPTNYLFLDALEKLKNCMGSDYQIPMSDGTSKSLDELSELLKNRLVGIFRKDAEGKRAVHGEYIPYSGDPHWKDLILFYEHYHGDTGRGLGASHQTGWSGLIANVIDRLQR